MRLTRISTSIAQRKGVLRKAKALRERDIFLEKDGDGIPIGNAMKRDACMNPCSKGKVQMQTLHESEEGITGEGTGIPHKTCHRLQHSSHQT